MNVPLESLDELARRAREEQTEAGDVRDAVLNRLRTEPAPPYSCLLYTSPSPRDS